jgi:D-tyrosyl-tRNA(Tyr) deacylase
VTVEGAIIGSIGTGLLAYVGAAPDDADSDVRYLAEKIATLRVFPDAEGKMNRSVLDIAGDILLVSAFTVTADARKGRRPSFDSSAPGEIARPLIERLETLLRATGVRVETGRFAAHMDVESSNDGPICIILDSRRAV